MAIIIDVTKGSPAKRAGLKKGERLIAVNGRPFEDILDYIYADGEECVRLTVADPKGRERTVTVEKDFDEEIGLELDDSAEITPRTCRNKCMFCFVDQLPKGMRPSLSVKDDDYRLSFTCGCYVTGTNLSEHDIQRIVDYKMSPLYVSVHATDPEVRTRLLGRKKQDDQMGLLRRLTQNGIRINTQIVLVPGINDGAVLERSLDDLYNLGENVLSVAVVPVGLTRHREGLPLLRPVSKEEAARIIDTVEAFYDAHGGFAYCSDEMYQIAGRNVHDAAYYGDFLQIENGVGLIAKFLSEVDEALEYAPDSVAKRHIAVITGVSGATNIAEAFDRIGKKWDNVTAEIFPVVNRFFGETVTVTGLVTATDIIATLAEEDLSRFDTVVIPSVMLKEFETVFLDDVSVAELEARLGCRLTVVAADGEALIDAVAWDDGDGR